MSKECPNLKSQSRWRTFVNDARYDGRWCRLCAACNPGEICVFGAWDFIGHWDLNIGIFFKRSTGGDSCDDPTVPAPVVAQGDQLRLRQRASVRSGRAADGSN